MEHDPSQLIAVLKRIPLFQNLKPRQAIVLLKACEQRAIGVGEVLCEFGGRSDAMFILLSGELSVRTEQGFQVARIAPIAPVGEMGIFTGEPRSATVVALKPSAFFALSKARLDLLLRQHPDIELAISRNLIRTLSQRIRDANRELTHLRGLLSDQEAGTETLKKAEEELEAEEAEGGLPPSP